MHSAPLRFGSIKNSQWCMPTWADVACFTRNQHPVCYRISDSSVFRHFDCELSKTNQNSNKIVLTVHTCMSTTCGKKYCFSIVFQHSLCSESGRASMKLRSKKKINRRNVTLRYCGDWWCGTFTSWPDAGCSAGIVDSIERMWLRFRINCGCWMLSDIFLVLIHEVDVNLFISMQHDSTA